MNIISELSTKDLLKVAQTLVGHQTNRIEAALEKHLLRATPDKVRRDLERIGIVQCQGCSIWWWVDQIEGGYCHSLCRGADVTENEKSAEIDPTTQKRKLKSAINYIVLSASQKGSKFRHRKFKNPYI